MYGNDYGYAATRLDDSIARLVDGTPIYIRAVGINGDVHYFDLEVVGSPEQKGKIAKFNNLNLEPVPLGYVQTRNGCVYAQRLPIRKWKQGLRMGENCTLNNNNVDYKALTSSIKGEYPKFENIVNKDNVAYNNPFKRPMLVTKEAWHRHWAVDRKNKTVEYRGEVVGKIVDGRPQLEPKFKYLQECLEESL